MSIFLHVMAWDDRGRWGESNALRIVEFHVVGVEIWIFEGIFVVDTISVKVSLRWFSACDSWKPLKYDVLESLFMVYIEVGCEDLSSSKNCNTYISDHLVGREEFCFGCSKERLGQWRCEALFQGVKRGPKLLKGGWGYFLSCIVLWSVLGSFGRCENLRKVFNSQDSEPCCRKLQEKWGMSKDYKGLEWPRTSIKVLLPS